MLNATLVSLHMHSSCSRIKSNENMLLCVLLIESHHCDEVDFVWRKDSSYSKRSTQTEEQ